MRIIIAKQKDFQRSLFKHKLYGSPYRSRAFNSLQYVDDKEYLYSFYTVSDWQGEPEIKEQEKCDDLSWFSLDALPENIMPVTKLVLEKYKSGVTYTEYIPQA